MPDRSTENLERIRACDAGWNENDHPRANNGQFTSGGGGVKVSKATPDMKKGKHKYGNRQGFGKPAEEAAYNEKKAKIKAKSDDLTTRVGGMGNAKTAKERRKVLAGARQTLEKARPKIAAMRELAKAAKASAQKKAPTSKSKPTTRFDKDMAKADKSYEDFREVMQKRKSEIEVLRERLRTTKNSFVAQATKQELDRLVSEYNRLDEMY